jgi:hypothetical protein
MAAGSLRLCPREKAASISSYSIRSYSLGAAFIRGKEGDPATIRLPCADTAEITGDVMVTCEAQTAETSSKPVQRSICANRNEVMDLC